ncbi:MAG: M20/M25/M40 family metallo-hydrolase [Chloroflexota bacterium]
MPDLDVVSLAKELINIQSVSRHSNVPVTDFIETWLAPIGFEIERLEYIDENDQRKANLIAKLGEGRGGVALCSHSDTVPGQEDQWPAFEAAVKDGRLYGRGSCDMKGPLAATMITAATIDATALKQPLYIIVTADEELGLHGAKYVAEHSEILREAHPHYGIIAEPTQLVPVNAHKGYADIYATAYGVAAHTSTGKGESSTFQVAFFMADMARLAEQLKTDKSFMNEAFVPPTNGFNMIVDDGNCAINVTASQTTVGISFRTMPDSRADELIAMIIEAAEKYGLETRMSHDPILHTPPEATIIQTACDLTGNAAPQVVSYSTDGVHLQHRIDELVVLGPGDIALAHTVGEFIPVSELEASVGIYQQMIERLCM